MLTGSNPHFGAFTIILHYFGAFCLAATCCSALAACRAHARTLNPPR